LGSPRRRRPVGRAPRIAALPHWWCPRFGEGRTGVQALCGVETSHALAGVDAAAGVPWARTRKTHGAPQTPQQAKPWKSFTGGLRCLLSPLPTVAPTPAALTWEPGTHGGFSTGWPRGRSPAKQVRGRCSLWWPSKQNPRAQAGVGSCMVPPKLAPGIRASPPACTVAGAAYRGFSPWCAPWERGSANEVGQGVVPRSCARGGTRLRGVGPATVLAGRRGTSCRHRSALGGAPASAPSHATRQWTRTGGLGHSS
jgi:hypothetical protein